MCKQNLHKVQVNQYPTTDRDFIRSNKQLTRLASNTLTGLQASDQLAYIQQRDAKASCHT